MPLTTESKVVARCDNPGCNSLRYGSKSEPPVGYYATVEHVQEDNDGVGSETVEIYACSTAHLNKAVVWRLTQEPGHGQMTAYSMIDDETGAAVVTHEVRPEHQGAGERAESA